MLLCWTVDKLCVWVCVRACVCVCVCACVGPLSSASKWKGQATSNEFLMAKLLSELVFTVLIVPFWFISVQQNLTSSHHTAGSLQRPSVFSLRRELLMHQSEQEYSLTMTQKRKAGKGNKQQKAEHCLLEYEITRGRWQSWNWKSQTGWTYHEGCSG